MFRLTELDATATQDFVIRAKCHSSPTNSARRRAQAPPPPPRNPSLPFLLGSLRMYFLIVDRPQGESCPAVTEGTRGL